MNKKQILLAFLCGMVIPLMGLALIHGEQEEPAEETTPSTAAADRERTVAVMTHEGSVERMPLEEYLTGVVLSEMPASFHEEALRAQAVVARTYAVKRESQSKHAPAAVCLEPSCCQGYISPEEYLSGGGDAEAVEKAASAVADTGELVLTYGGELIDATYFSCSGGSTEAAVEVWGTDVPYLQSVSSPGEENAAHYEDEVRMTAGEFGAVFGIGGEPEGWIGKVHYTEGGGVETVEIGGVEYGGTQVRQLLGLKSTAFDIGVDGSEIVISTRGFGHRVGMSQYGAQAMAETGSGYEEILTYYYQGAELVEME